jgi:hypothetical protein
MNLPPQFIDSLMQFGYTQPEAQFLYVVATQSGYFTQTQFLNFVGAHHSRRWQSSLFAKKVLNNGHAKTRNYLGYGLTYHLCSRPLYNAIAKGELRYRQAHSVEFIRTRLVLLDFLLAHREANYLDTEQEKIHFFCETLGISLEHLPARAYERGRGRCRTVRYFPDEFPMFLAPPAKGLPPLITFSYVDSGCASIPAFRAHLTKYQPLFRQLAGFRFLFISPKPLKFEAATERFRSMVKTPLESGASHELLRYFEVRRKWENHEYIVPVTKDLEFLKCAQRRFEGERFEALYCSWKSGQLNEENLQREFCQTSPQRTIYFETCLVDTHRSHLDKSERRRTQHMKDPGQLPSLLRGAPGGLTEEQERPFEEAVGEET